MCAEAFICIMRSSSTSDSHKISSTSFKIVSHWFGQGATLLNWNNPLWCRKDNRLQANSPQLPNSNVESVRGNPIKSCNKQSLIWAKQSTNWWNWHPLSLNTTTLHSSTNMIVSTHYQAQATIFITFALGWNILDLVHFRLSIWSDLVFWSFTQALTVSFPNFQMVSSWGAHSSPGSFPGRQVWRGWLGNDSSGKSPIGVGGQSNRYGWKYLKKEFVNFHFAASIASLPNQGWAFSWNIGSLSVWKYSVKYFA